MSATHLSRLFVVVCLIGAVAAARAEPVTDTAKQEAAARFDRGVAYYGAGNFKAALAEFEASYRLTGQFEILFNIAVTQRSLFRYSDAMQSFQRYLDDGGSAVPAQRRADVAAELAEIVRTTAEVRIEVAGAPASIEVDGSAVGTAPVTLLLGSGPHVVRASREGELPDERKLEVISGAKVVVTLAPKAAPPPQRNARLQVTSRPAGAELMVDTRGVGRAPWSGVVDAGGHRVHARLAGFRDADVEVMLAAGQTRPLLLELSALPEVRRSRWYTRWYVIAGGAALAAGLGVAVYLVARPHYDLRYHVP